MFSFVWVASIAVSNFPGSFTGPLFFLLLDEDDDDECDDDFIECDDDFMECDDDFITPVAHNTMMTTTTKTASTINFLCFTTISLYKRDK